MELGFDRDDILGDIAEGLRAEQGDGFKKTLFYKILDKVGHPLTTSAHWYDADNLLDFYSLLTLVKLFGPGFANRAYARLGLKLVPLGSGEIDGIRALERISRIHEISGELSQEFETAIDNGGNAKEDAA